LVTEQDVRGVLAKAPDRKAEIERVLTILERALNYRQCVRVLHESLDVPGSVRRWRSSDPDVGEPRLAQAQAIERLRRIALVLVQSRTFFDLRGVGVWLQTGLRNLEWKAPYELLASPDGFHAAVHEAELFVQPGAGAAAAGFGPPSPDQYSPPEESSRELEPAGARR
jgi:hypothetical protein